MPLRMSLTEEGINFFMRNKKKINRFRLADGSESFGIHLKSFSLPSLQQMMHLNYITRFEISETEFMARRQEILDFSKLIVYGMLYRAFDGVIFSSLIKSDLIRQWNRNNPVNPIDGRTRINDSFLEGVLSRNAALINEVKNEILKPISRSINDNHALLPEEKNIQLLSTERYLQKLRPLIWFILSRYRDSSDYPVLLEQIRRNLTEFLEKSKLAEYLSLMILELLSNAENTNLQAYARKSAENGADPEKVLYDSKLRTSLIREMKRAGEKIFIDWRIRGKNSNHSTGERLEVTLYNRDSEYRDLREKINNKKGLDMREKSLTDFYSQAPSSVPNTELGLYYLSYLSEECSKVGVRFESNVHQISTRDLTIITLQFQF
jgi:hypothetical protein